MHLPNRTYDVKLVPPRTVTDGGCRNRNNSNPPHLPCGTAATFRPHLWTVSKEMERSLPSESSRSFASLWGCFTWQHPVTRHPWGDLKSPTHTPGTAPSTLSPCNPSAIRSTRRLSARETVYMLHVGGSTIAATCSQFHRCREKSGRLGWCVFEYSKALGAYVQAYARSHHPRIKVWVGPVHTWRRD